MHSFLMLIFALVAAHPYESLAGTYLALNVTNAVLPARVVTSRPGAVLHRVIDAFSVLVRRDAYGTLKPPFVASVLVFVADSIAPPRPVPGAELPRDPAVPIPIAPAPSGSRAGERGRATVDVVLFCWTLPVVLTASAAVLVWSLEGCHPRLPPVAGCRPNATRCWADQPEICSPTQRWQPEGDMPCGEAGGVCLEDADAGAYCGRAAADAGDAGVAADAAGGDAS